MIGINLGHLSKLESGQAEPKLIIVTRLAWALGVDPSELVVRLLPPELRSTEPPDYGTPPAVP